MDGSGTPPCMINSGSGYLRIRGKGYWITSIDVTEYSCLAAHIKSIDLYGGGLYAPNLGGGQLGQCQWPAIYIKGLYSMQQIGFCVYDRSDDEYTEIYDLWLE